MFCMSKPKRLPSACCRSGDFIRKVSLYICPVFLFFHRHLSLTSGRMKPSGSVDLWSDQVLPSLPSFHLHLRQWSGDLYISVAYTDILVPQVTCFHAIHEYHPWLQKDISNLTAGLSACKLVIWATNKFGLRLSLRFVLKSSHILQLCLSGCPLTRAQSRFSLASFFCIKCFFISETSNPTQKHPFLNVRPPFKGSTPKLFIIPNYTLTLINLSLETKAGYTLQATVSSYVTAYSMIGKLPEFVGNQVHNFITFSELNIAHLGSERTFLPRKRLKICRALSEASG